MQTLNETQTKLPGGGWGVVDGPIVPRQVPPPATRPVLPPMLQ